MTIPFALKTTVLTVPSKSLALAETVTGVPAATVLPVDGLVSVMVGGLFPVTVSRTEEDVTTLPELSVARAVRV